jgi:hypothetical protein
MYFKNNVRVDWIQLARNDVQLQSLVNTVMNIWVP